MGTWGKLREVRRMELVARVGIAEVKLRQLRNLRVQPGDEVDFTAAEWHLTDELAICGKELAKLTREDQEEQGDA